jgi:hypothetical protein
MIPKAKIIFCSWLLTILGLFLYSFTQIDLGLTLTRASFWQPIQKAFQQIGYFQRPLSTAFYLIILTAMFGLYFIILKAVNSQWLAKKQIWLLMVLTAGLLWLSYNAFSYDLFNYMFDAKVVTFYHLSPYQYRALDFPDDPMLGFMHWTHRLYPYGPLWLATTIPLSFLGMQKLIPTALLIKGLGVGSYLLSAWLIFKILEKIDPKNRLLGMVIFAFNPLVVIESLVSGHNDILMMALMLLAFWLMLRKKTILGWLSFLLSIGIKFATGLLLPVFVFVSVFQSKKAKLDWGKVWLISLGLMFAGVVLAGFRIGEIKPWYWLFVIPFTGLLPRAKWLWLLTTSLSLGLLLHYAPFLYFGHWDPPVPLIKQGLTFGFLILGVLSWLVLKLLKHEKVIPSGR